MSLSCPDDPVILVVHHDGVLFVADELDQPSRRDAFYGGGISGQE